MPQPKLVKSVYRLHLSLFRELNDIHIFLSHTLPLLDETALKYRAIKSTMDKTFKVPSRFGKYGITRRTPKEIAGLFEKFAHRELHANLLLVCVSRFEFFLNDVLRLFMNTFPEKLSVGLKGGDSSKQVPISVIVDATNIEEARRSVAESRLQGVFYAEPKDYLAYFKSIAGVDISQKLFNSFVETKATRDLIIHNDGDINALYLRKSKKRARGKLGDRIPLDDEYFEQCISVMKSISSEIENQVRAVHDAPKT